MGDGPLQRGSSRVYKVISMAFDCWWSTPFMDTVNSEVNTDLSLERELVRTRPLSSPREEGGAGRLVGS